MNLKVAFASESYSSINSYGYSPIPLKDYLSMVIRLFQEHPGRRKPVIIGITTSDTLELVEMLKMIVTANDALDSCFESETKNPASSFIGVELNTSCPNIPHKPPPSYDPTVLSVFVEALRSFNESLQQSGHLSLTLGLKLPPYTYSKQFEDTIQILKEAKTRFPNSISFITCTNTLGSSVLFSDQAVASSSSSLGSNGFALPTEFGGLAGEAIHSLALG